MRHQRMRFLVHRTFFSPLAWLRIASITLVFAVVFLSGCTLQYPVWLGQGEINTMCTQSGLHNVDHDGVTRNFYVHLVDHQEIKEICGIAHNGNFAQACIVDNFDIYVPLGRNCPVSMAHELSHGFGLHFVDRPRVGRGFDRG